MRQLPCQFHSDRFSRCTLRYLDLEVDEAIEIAEKILSDAHTIASSTHKVGGNVIAIAADFGSTDDRSCD
jgi:hypothetical protein